MSKDWPKNKNELGLLFKFIEKTKIQHSKLILNSTEEIHLLKEYYSDIKNLDDNKFKKLFNEDTTSVDAKGNIYKNNKPVQSISEMLSNDF